MAEDWDFYMCEIEDHVASIFLNLSLTDATEGLTHLLAIDVTMNSPREDGLSSKEEAEALYELEDTLVAAIEYTKHQYVGRHTHQNHRVFYAYGPTADHVEQLIVDAFAAKDIAYAFEITQQADDQWQFYKEWLYPAPLEMHDIQNRRVVMKLSEHGDQLDTPRPVDHSSYFPKAQDVSPFVTALESMGFETDTESYEDDIIVQYSREDAVEIHHINALVRELCVLSEQHDGTYDGWGCPIVA